LHQSASIWSAILTDTVIVTKSFANYFAAQYGSVKKSTVPGSEEEQHMLAGPHEIEETALTEPFTDSYGGRQNPYDQRQGGAPGGGYNAPQAPYPSGGGSYDMPQPQYDNAAPAYGGGNNRYNNQPAMGRDNYG
jgi:hypothetical protein